MLRFPGSLMAAMLTICSSLGCGRAYPACESPDYLLAEARSSLVFGRQPGVEVSDTAEYQQAQRQLLGPGATPTVAIRLPDTCLPNTKTAHRADGRDDHCSLWLSELERTLSGAGFKVVSWDSLQSLRTSEGLAWFQTAKQLGADVLFTFNRLDLSDVAPGAQARWNIRYFRSDARGQPLAAWPLQATERAPIKRYVEDRMNSKATQTASAGAMALAASLDATAVLTTTGQSIWFYRNSTVEALDASRGRRFLFKRGADTWYPEVPRQLSSSESATLATAEDVAEIQAPTPTDPDRHRRTALVHQLASQFVSHFRYGMQP